MNTVSGSIMQMKYDPCVAWLKFSYKWVWALMKTNDNMVERIELFLSGFKIKAKIFFTIFLQTTLKK